MFDISSALFCKLWWNSRTKPSQWSSFMLKKYCKKNHPVISHARYGSIVWKKMVEVREWVEHQIWRQIRSGNSSFWYDNWTTLGALYFIILEATCTKEIEVKELADQNGWKRNRLTQLLPQDIVDHICQTIPPDRKSVV